MVESSEGFYVGLAGNVKELWAELCGMPAGEALRTLGQFLDKVNSCNCVLPKDESYHQEHVKENKIIDKCSDEMINLFRKHGHSGGSSMVAQQMLIAMMGSNAVNKETRGYIDNVDDHVVTKYRQLTDTYVGGKNYNAK